MVTNLLVDVAIVSLVPEDRWVGGVLNTDKDKATFVGTVAGLCTIGDKVLSRGRGGDGVRPAYQRGETRV